MERHRLEVLHDGGKVKLVTGAGQTSEPHAFEPVVSLEMSKAHLDALAFIPRLKEALCAHKPSRHIAGILVNVAGYLSGGHIWTASHLQRASIAVEFGGTVAEHVAVVHGAGGVQHLVVWTNVEAATLVPAEVTA